MSRILLDTPLELCGMLKIFEELTESRKWLIERKTNRYKSKQAMLFWIHL